MHGNGSLLYLMLSHVTLSEVKRRHPVQQVYFGLKEAMITLLENGHDLNSKDSSGRTSLSYAVEKGYEAVVKLLVEKGAELETKDEEYGGWTPLSWAASRGHEEVVKLLLEKGAELETKDKYYGQTPLLYAAWRGHEAVVGSEAAAGERR